MFGKRILVAIPHPDDEAVACAASIGRAREEGAEVFALYLTHGCIAWHTMWPWQRKHYDTFVARRHAEAEEAAAFLGLAPVGWSSRPARHLWRDLPQVHAEIESAIARHGIDQLWVPAYEGGNADHDGLNALGGIFAQRLSVLEFAEYNFAGRRAHSQAFPVANGSEQVLELSPEERARKTEALAIYRSEQRNLNYVKTARECWRPIMAYDYARPPHAGTLWYTRFQWVPFRHPRVDFTNPQEVSGAITHFLKTRT